MEIEFKKIILFLYDKALKYKKSDLKIKIIVGGIYEFNGH